MQDKDNVGNLLLYAEGGKPAHWVQKKSREYVKLMSYYKSAMMEVETRFHALNELNMTEPRLAA